MALLLVALYATRVIAPAQEPSGPTPTAAVATPAASEQNEAAVLIEEEEDEGAEVSRVLVSLIVILLAAKLGGELLERIGQPAVLGELALGMVIGNLSLAGYHGLDFLKTDLVLEILAEIGVILLLFEVGLESNLREMTQVGLSAFLVACLGVIVPFFLGWGVAAYFWEDLTALMKPEMAAAVAPFATYVHVFIGAVLCATSVGITARVLQDMGKIRTRESRIILGAAVFDDVLGLIILAVCVGIVSAVGGGKPLRLDRVEKQVAGFQVTSGKKTQLFVEHVNKRLQEGKRSGYLYNVRTKHGQFLGRDAAPAFQDTIERQLDAIQSDREIEQQEAAAIARVEQFDQLGFRLYLERTEFHSIDILWIVLISVAFFVGMATAGLLLVQPIYRLASYLRVHGVLLTSALLICFLAAYVAKKIGLAPIVGAFMAGLILEDVHFRELPDRRKHNLHDLLAPLTTFLTPIFFVRMGILVDLSSFGNVSILGFALALTVAAILGKQVCSLGVVERGLNRTAVGLGMIPRGEVGLIFANEGTKLTLNGAPVVDPNILSAVVIMVIVTTLVTPPVLKWRFGRKRKRSPSAREKPEPETSEE